MGPTGSRNSRRQEAAESEGSSFSETSSSEAASASDLHARLAVLKHEEAACDKQLAEVAGRWAHRQRQLQGKVDSNAKEISRLELEVYNVYHKMAFGRLPPKGPQRLRFVDGGRFSSFIAVVIVANTFTMTLRLIHPQHDKALRDVDSGFLAIYIVELILRVVYYRSSFLIGPVSLVWSHWLDSALVADGILLFFRQSSKPRSLSGYFRMLRLVRYLRILKIVQFLRRSNIAWVQGERFEGIMLVVIAANVLFMGVEIEYPEYEFLWFYMDNIFVLTFTFELACRVVHFGCAFFVDPARWHWNWLDVVIVLGGILDQWVLPALILINRSVGTWSNTMRFVQMLRLLRVIRVTRILRKVPQLYALLSGVFQAMQGMSWVMLLTLLVLYTCALVGVKLVGPRGIITSMGDAVQHKTVSTRRLHGHGGVGGAGDAGLDGPASAFPSLLDAMFNLFKVMQMDLSPMEPLFEWVPATKCVILVFVVVTNWAIFSILTAVVSEEMARATQADQEEMLEREKNQLSERLAEKIFDRADTDKSGFVSKSQLYSILKEEHEAQEFCFVMDLSREDLDEFVHILSRGEDGEEHVISREHFLHALEKQMHSVSQRCMMKLEKRLDHWGIQARTGMAKLEDLAVKWGDANAVATTRTPSPGFMASPSSGSPVSFRSASWPMWQLPLLSARTSAEQATPDLAISRVVPPGSDAGTTLPT
mmetsp:Transcript_11131/g.27858  ORF Transcript_11131/g.27858 Transcript_11131/m.27858 type:complete len:706 (-) Transcript_11131:108-2225(-)